MSPEKPTPQHDDEATAKAVIAQGLAAAMTDDAPNYYAWLASKAVEALKAAGFEIVKRSDLGSIKRTERDLSGSLMGPALDQLAPGASQAAQTGFDLVNRTIARAEEAAQRAIEAEAELAQAQTGVQLGLNPDLPNAPEWMQQLLDDLAERRDRPALSLALDLIGRRTDIVAVQLPEPTHSGNVSTSWGWVTQWHPTHQVRGQTRLITVDDPGRCFTTAEARNLAAALLAAAARVDSAEGEAK